MMIDEHDNAFTEELATSLRAAAASTPRTADPYGPVGPAIARDRRRRTGIGASLAVVAVLGAAVGIGNEVGRGGRASDQSAAAGPTTRTTTAAVAPTTSPTAHAAAPTSKPSTPHTPPKVSPQIMLGWPTDFELFPGWKTSESQAAPTVDAMIHAYGKPVDDSTRAVLTELVGSFKLCGYPLSSYTFTLRWTGDLAHSGGYGAAVVDITHGGATYRMYGSDIYKGIWLQLPTTVDAAEAAHVEAAPLPELDQPAQVFYAAVVAAPGSKVTISGTESYAPDPGQSSFQTDPVTVGASGVAEVKLTSRDGNGLLPFPTITSVTVVRPDGTTAAVPLVGGTSTAQEQAARQLLPADTTCPGPAPAMPLS